MRRTIDFRRAQREKRIRRRMRQRAIENYPPVPPGQLADGARMGCSDGRHCAVCKPGKAPRVPTVQEQREGQEDATE